jgi:hypothetical protein
VVATVMPEPIKASLQPQSYNAGTRLMQLYTLFQAMIALCICANPTLIFASISHKLYKSWKVILGKT